MAGGGRSGGSGGGGGGSSSALKVTIESTELTNLDGKGQVLVGLSVGASEHPVTLATDIGVRNDTGREVSAPLGSVEPVASMLIGTDGQRLAPDRAGTFVLPAGDESHWTLVVDHEQSAVLRLDVTANSATPREAT